SHCSGASHPPTEGRQMVVLPATPSDGHAAEDPSQTSPTSQTPVAARQGVPPAAKAFGGQSTALPLHVSARSQGPALGRHGVAEALGVQSPSLVAPARALQTPQSHTTLQQMPLTQK